MKDADIRRQDTFGLNAVGIALSQLVTLGNTYKGEGCFRTAAMVRREAKAWAARPCATDLELMHEIGRLYALARNAPDMTNEEAAKTIRWEKWR